MNFPQISVFPLNPFENVEYSFEVSGHRISFLSKFLVKTKMLIYFVEIYRPVHSEKKKCT